MQLHSFCHQADELLEELRSGVMSSNPAGLAALAAELERFQERFPLALVGATPPTVQDGLALAALRSKIRPLGAQLQQASNLAAGWAQLRLGGYTRRGQPVATGVEARATYEA